MTFWRCYYHIVWATKHREPLITPQSEQVIFEAVHAKSAELECPILAINGAGDHVHVAVSIIPKLSVAEWVRNVKGVSTHEMNSRFPNAPVRFAWQKGYSVLTFGAKNLAFVVDYIAHQKEHHADNQLEAYLEHIEDTDQPL